MKKIVYRSEDRGKANHGWLDSKFSFSFAEYYDPQKINFGMLRVLNDDIIAPGTGFGTHPHNNMEIITIVLDGELEHRDSMGTGSVIHKNEVQVMSAGSGITHSEYNHSDSDSLNLLQLWIFSKEKNIKPRYDQKLFLPDQRLNQLVTVVSGFNEEDSLYIHQDAEIKLGNFDKGQELRYNLRTDKGIYMFLISGRVEVLNESLFKRDAIGIYDTDEIEIKISERAEFVIIEVPMNLE
jgi:redox-sensitive bicupin YhaK (pirin superfamily)